MRLVGKRHIAISALVACLALGVGAAVQATKPPPSVARVDEASRARALALVAAREGVPVGDLRIIASAQGSYPEQRLTVASFKIYDRVHDSIHVISLDANGQEVDEEALVRRDYDLARQERGALHPLFAETIKAAAPTDEFDVVINVLSPSQPEPGPTGTNVTQEQVEAFLAAATERRRREVAVAVAPVIAWLQAKGVQLNGGTDAPFLYGRLTAADIRELSRRPEIVMIEGQARPRPWPP